MEESPMIGVGTDIVNFSHLRAITLVQEDPFIQKTYTPNEIAQAISRPEPFYYYVTRFAGKEAVFKSLAISGEGVSLKEIEILNDAEGRPNVILHGEIAKRALQSSCAQVKISLSYDTDYAVAFAIAADGRSI
jgi:holo-[acyl-carrier protein] synthase